MFMFEHEPPLATSAVASGKRAVIAEEMGTGRTVQARNIARHYRPRRCKWPMTKGRTRRSPRTMARKPRKLPWKGCSRIAVRVLQRYNLRPLFTPHEQKQRRGTAAELRRREDLAGDRQRVEADID